MKKISKKLSLNRETLATLSPELLDAVNGGQADVSAVTGTTPRTTNPTIVSVPMSRIGCPSRLPGICETDPTRTRLICGPQGGTQK